MYQYKQLEYNNCNRLISNMNTQINGSFHSNVFILLFFLSSSAVFISPFFFCSVSFEIETNDNKQQFKVNRFSIEIVFSFFFFLKSVIEIQRREKYDLLNERYLFLLFYYYYFFSLSLFKLK